MRVRTNQHVQRNTTISTPCVLHALCVILLEIGLVEVAHVLIANHGLSYTDWFYPFPSQMRKNQTWKVQLGPHSLNMARSSLCIIK